MMLPARNYESEHTKFIRQLLQKNPELEQEQQKARAIWWDKQPLDLAARKTMEEGNVPQTPYVYPDE
jgi:hypothetical protein